MLVRTFIFLFQENHEVDMVNFVDELVTLKKKCTCLPNCDEVNYVLEDLDTREWFLGSNLQWGLKEYPRMRLKRDVLFGFADLLGNFCLHLIIVKTGMVIIFRGLLQFMSEV